MDQNKLKSYIQRGVMLKREQETLKEDMKALAEEAKEDIEIKSAEFNARVIAAFDKEKAREKIQEAEKVLDEIEGLGL